MQFHEMYMDKIHNHEVAGSIPAPATESNAERKAVTEVPVGCLPSFFKVFVVIDTLNIVSCRGQTHLLPAAP